VRAPIVGMLLVCLISETAVLAAEHPIRDAGVRAVTRLASQAPATSTDPAESAPAARPNRHPVLIGAIIGGGAGAVLGAVGTSCSAEPSAIDPAPCGTHPWVLGALLGGAVGSGVGALIGLAVKAISN
jgi:hypothetical protein